MVLHFVGMSVSAGDADADMSGPDVGDSELEAGIVNVVASFPGAGASSSVMEGYDRYMGGKDYADGEPVTEDPEETVGTAFQSFVLDPAVVDGGTWSSYPPADFMWDSLVALRRSDVRRVGVVALSRPQCAEIVRSSFVERSRCRFPIPSEICCDRTFVEEARDGLYVTAMHTWLIGGCTPMPVLTTATIRNVVMEERSAHEWKTSLAMRMGSDRVISFADYQCLRSLDAHETDVWFCGRFDERTTMLVPFYESPMIPLVVAGIVPPLSLAVRLPRVAYYFGNMEKPQGADVRECYERAYVIEWAYAMSAALALDVEVFRRVWVCDTECIGFLR